MVQRNASPVMTLLSLGVAVVLLSSALEAVSATTRIDNQVHQYIVTCVPLPLGPNVGQRKMMTKPPKAHDDPVCTRLHTAALKSFREDDGALRTFVEALQAVKYPVAPAEAWKRFQREEKHVYEPQAQAVPARRPSASADNLKHLIKEKQKYGGIAISNVLYDEDAPPKPKQGASASSSSGGGGLGPLRIKQPDPISFGALGSKTPTAALRSTGSKLGGGHMNGGTHFLQLAAQRHRRQAAARTGARDPPTNGGKGPLPFSGPVWPCKTIPFCLREWVGSCTAENLAVVDSDLGRFYTMVTAAQQMLAKDDVDAHFTPVDKTDICSCDKPGHKLVITHHNGAGSSSTVGFQGKFGVSSLSAHPAAMSTEQVTTIDTAYATPLITLHELLHALGFSHMHQRDDRDDYLYVRPYLDQGRCHVNYDKLPYARFLGEYDWQSVMHYGATDAMSCTVSSLDNILSATGAWVAKGHHPTCRDQAQDSTSPESCVIGWHYYSYGDMTEITKADATSVFAHYHDLAKEPSDAVQC